MDGKNSTCCFTGNRPEKLPWGEDETHPDCLEFVRRLNETLDALYDDGFRHFICGMARGGDTWFAEAVLRLKRAHGDVTLEAAVPYPKQAARWSDGDRKRYEKILVQCDKVTTVSPVYTRYCLHARNRYMVDRSQAVVSLLRSSGGTANTVRYATQKGVRIIAL